MISYTGQEKLLKPFTLLLCAHRMLYPDMGMKWIGDWPVQPQNLRSHVTECVTLVLPLVQGRANWVLAKPPHVRAERCVYRVIDPSLEIDMEQESVRPESVQASLLRSEFWGYSI